MKLFISACLLAFSCSAKAQTDLKKLQEYLKTPKVISSPLLATSMVKAKFLFDSDKGKVYALPLDNMRCFVPAGYYSKMPNSQKQIQMGSDKIPNALPKFELIPQGTMQLNLGNK